MCSASPSIVIVDNPAALIAADDGVESIKDYSKPLEPTKIRAISKLLPLERRSIRPHGPTVVVPSKTPLSYTLTVSPGVPLPLMTGVL